MTERNLVLPQISQNITTSDLITIYNQIESGNFTRNDFRVSHPFGGSGGVPKWRILEKETENRRHILMICLFSCHFDPNAPILVEDRRLSPEIQNMINYLAMDLKSNSKKISIDGSSVELNVHAGYYLAARNVVTTLEGELNQRGLNLCNFNEVIFFGHSLGGAVAEIAAIYLRENFQYRHIKGFGFGIPRCISRSFCELTARYCLTLTNPDDPFTTYKTAAKLIAKANGLRILERTNIELFMDKMRELDNATLSEYCFPEMNVNVVNYGVDVDNTTYIKSTLRWKEQPREPQEYTPDGEIIVEQEYTLQELVYRKDIYTASYYQKMVERAINDSQDEYEDNEIFGDVDAQDFNDTYQRKSESYNTMRNDFEDHVRDNLNLHTGDIRLTLITPESDENERQEIVNQIESERARVMEAYVQFEENQRSEMEMRANEELIREDERRRQQAELERIIEEERERLQAELQRIREDERRSVREWFQAQLEIIEANMKRRNLNIGIAVACGLLSAILLPVGGLGIAAAAVPAFATTIGVAGTAAVAGGAAVGVTGIAAGGTTVAGTVVHSKKAERLKKGYVEMNP